MNIWWEALALFLPAGIANMAPPVASKIPYLKRWNTPMDFGRTYRGRRIFGTNKTWRGFFIGTASGVLAGALVHDLFFPDVDWATYLVRCAAIGAGSLCGDAVKSFFKRQRNTPPGNPWFPFDQLDYILGGLLFLIPFGLPHPLGIFAIFVTYFGGHLLAVYIGYRLGIRERPI